MAALRFAMIGCGAFARRYHLPAIDADADASIAAIFDPHANAEVREIARRYGCEVTSRIEDALKPERIDAAIVTTPHALHAEHVHRVLDAGVAVLVDKPFTLSSADARALAERADRKRIVNAVAFNRRFDRACLRAREAIRGNELGTIRYVETVQLGWERAGWFLDPALNGPGPFTGRLTHMADTLPWLIGVAPERVRSRVWPARTAGRTDRGGLAQFDCGEVAAQLACLEDGLHMWDEIRVFGDTGIIELRRPLDLPIGWQLRRYAGDRMAEEQAADATPGDATRDFFQALRAGSRPRCTFADAVLSVRLVEAAYQSASRGETWIAVDTA
jgi:predicted dehydrogenase